MNTIKLKKRWTISSIPWLIAATYGLLALFFVLFHDTTYSPLKFNRVEAPAAPQNQFLAYLDHHSCRRVIWTVFPMREEIRYTCDNGWWREAEIMNLLNGQYLPQQKAS